VDGTRDGSGRGGIAGAGGEVLCCFGGAGSGASDGSGGGEQTHVVFDGACSMSLAYCAVDWAGSHGEPGFQGGIGDLSRFTGLSGVTSVGPLLYVTHENGVSIVHAETREVTWLAGAEGSGDRDGSAEEARFNRPSGIAHHDGFLYVSDTGNRKIRRIDVETGEVSTYLTQFVSGPAGLNVLPEEGGEPAYLLIADEILHIVVRVEIAEAAPTPGVLTGTINTSGSNTVLLNAPYGLARIGKILYITERQNHGVRSIDLGQPSSSLSPVWGSGAPGFSEGTGEAAQLNGPTGIAADGGVLYVVDAANSVVRRGVPGASLEVVAGSVGEVGHVEGLGAEARFDVPRLIHVADDGDAYLAEDSALRRFSL